MTLEGWVIQESTDQISSRLWQGADVGCVLQHSVGEAVWQRVAFWQGSSQEEEPRAEATRSIPDSLR